MDKKDLANVREIHLKIGKLSCIEPQLLKHVFGFIIVDGPFQHANLFVDMVDITAECENCGYTFTVEKYRFVCTSCGKPVSNITKGKELTIYKIILEEPSYAEVNE